MRDHVTTDLALPTSPDQWVQAANTHPVQFVLATVVVLVAAGLTGLLLIRVSRRAKRAVVESGVTAERVLTLGTSAIASAVAAQGMFAFFTGIADMPAPLVFATFAFIELMVVASAMRARRSQLDTGSGGVDGIAMWVLTLLSGVLAATHAASVGEWMLRLIAPVVAAWGWERSMALERRKLTGRSGGTNWRISPQRLLVKWGITDPTDRSNAEVAIEHRLSELARAADAVRISRATNSPRRQQRAMNRLHRAIDRAASDGVVLGEESVRARLAEHLEGRFSAYTLPNFQPATDWADHATARAIVPTLDGTETDSAVRAEFDELTSDLDREFAARAEPKVSRAESSPRAIEDTSPIARETVARETVPAPEDLGIARANETDNDSSRAREFAREDSATARAVASEMPVSARETVAAERASRAAQSTVELGTDRAPIAAREDDMDTTARAIEEDAARDLTPVVALVRAPQPARAARETVSHSARANRAPIAREPMTNGALARATDTAPRAKSRVRDTAGVGPFARELTSADATRLARAVLDRGKSKQPVEVLAAIYHAKSQGLNANHIADQLVHLPHSTVGRAIDAAVAISGPRAVD